MGAAPDARLDALESAAAAAGATLLGMRTRIAVTGCRAEQLLLAADLDAARLRLDAVTRRADRLAHGAPPAGVGGASVHGAPITKGPPTPTPVHPVVVPARTVRCWDKELTVYRVDSRAALGACFGWLREQPPRKYFLKGTVHGN